MVITPLNFAECLMGYGMLFGDDRIKVKSQTNSESYQYISNIEASKDTKQKQELSDTLLAIKKYAEFFVDICLQSFELQHLTYSHQGMYALMAAREVMEVKPTWNKQLANFSNFTREDVDVEILKKLLKLAKHEACLSTDDGECNTPVECYTAANTTDLGWEKIEMVSPLSG